MIQHAGMSEPASAILRTVERFGPTGVVSRRAVLLGVAGLLVPGMAAADDGAAELLARIRRARAHVHTLRGPFEQVRIIRLLTAEVRSRGTMFLVRPDRLRWELGAPDDVTFWIGPGGLAYRGQHGGGRLPAATVRMGGALEDLRTLLGGDLEGLRDRWDLRVVRDDSHGAELEATPKAREEAAFKSLRLALDADLLRPTRALLVEGTQDSTRIEFGALDVNSVVDDALMRPPD